MDSLELFKEIYGGRKAWSGKEVTLSSAMQVSTALACGRVIAEGIAMMPWKVFQQQGKSINPAVTHPMYDKLAVSPNQLQTAFEFQETAGMHLAFCGNAIIWTPTIKGGVGEMYLLEPKWVTIKYTWPDLPTYEVRTDDGKSFTLTSKEVWHIRGPSWNSYIGMEFMNLARNAIGLAMAIEEGQSKLQEKGVNMPGYLSVEGSLTEDQQKKLRKWLEKEHSGSQNAGKAMIIDRAAKWIATGMTNIDAQVLDQRRFEVEEVCRFMRVLPIMVGHADKTATYASAEQMFLAHAMYTMGPWARRLEQSADKRLLTAEERSQGYYTKMNEKALLRMSAETQAKVITAYTNAGIMVRNEGRSLLELNPIDGLDLPLTPLNTVAGNPPTVDNQSTEKVTE